MNTQTAEFSIDDVVALAEWVIETSDDTNHNKASLWYCTHCGSEEQYDHKQRKHLPIVHKPDCITKIAQDVLTNHVKEQ